MSIYFKFEPNPFSRFFSIGEQRLRTNTHRQIDGNVKNPIPNTEIGVYSNASTSTNSAITKKGPFSAFIKRVVDSENIISGYSEA